MIPTERAQALMLEDLPTTELPAALPATWPPKLRALMDVHLRVTSHRHQERVASPDGTWWHLGAFTTYRVRTQHLVPVPPLERTHR